MNAKRIFARISLRSSQLYAKPTEMIFRFGKHQWEFPGIRVMGILNVTPDSFFDGGHFFQPSDAMAHVDRMVKQGADLIDVGGQSTRPLAKSVPLEMEIERVLPVIQQIKRQSGTLLSIDTTKAEVAKLAIANGVSIINDVSGGRQEPEILAVAAEMGVGFVLMHSRGTPETMQTLNRYSSVVDDVLAELEKAMGIAVAAGVSEEQIVIDPGFGFAKNTDQNLQILKNLARFKQLGRPLLVGVSRKSFLGALVNQEPEGRLSASITAQLLAMLHGADIIRTHDVGETVESVKILKAILAAKPSGMP